MSTVNTRRRSFFRIGAAAGLFAVVSAQWSIKGTLAAGDLIYTSKINNNAVSGYDPVAYFTVGRPVKGDPKYTLTHKGTNWLFSSQKNLDLFKANPDKYSPQFGGHCAYNASKGIAIRSNPLNFNIVDDKLYLNYDQYTQSLWYKNQSELIDRGKENWPTVFR